MHTIALQVLIDGYLEVFWQSAPASGLEAASRQILTVLSGEFPHTYIATLLTEAREAVASATEHQDISAFIYFTEKIALFEQFQTQIVDLS